MAGETSIFELEHRLRHKKGHWVWVLACGKITYDAEGRPVRASGIHQDISSRKRVSTEGAVLLKRIEGLISGLDKRVGAAGDMSPRSTSTGVRLSERNREILERIAEGKSTAAMAEELGISPATAKTHRRNLMRKLGLNNQAELIRYAIKHKIVNV